MPDIRISSAAPAAALLPCLNGVRETGAGRWIAQCPAHQDRRPSLAIRENSDGALLVYCFGGCDTAAVVAAVGLELRDLFPPTDRHHRPRERRPWHPLDVLRCLVTEAAVLSLAASDLAQGHPLSASDRERLELAAERLATALQLAEGA